ncbi:alpha/beta hydrolase fold [Desulfocucumis palustris]|uniref:Alpha/beta hydrolase fold n=1 Tax=Desulfocucumis palustris TaxID=1898651 RepID=A0A2L2XGV9_9FIRM|nr:alpha/beta hydrolase [Desulfocucumis palustris]GBF34953.1 alpha/beta hydrolase fold [Desulfocucumis palustris]
MPYVTMRGEKYHYGAGLPSPGNPKQAIIFVHGAGGSHRHWSEQVAELGKKYLVIAPDLPGHGLSGGAPLDSISAYSAFIRELAEILLGIPFYLAGHSMGGAVALDYVLNNPGRLAGLILIGTGSRLRVKQELLETFKNGNIPEGMENFLYSKDTPGNMLDAAARELKSVAPEVFYKDFLACDNFNVDTLLDDINVPTLVVSSAQDVMTPVKYGRRLADGIRKAEFKIIDGAGHMMMLEQPAGLNKAIAEFINT